MMKLIKLLLEPKVILIGAVLYTLFLCFGSLLSTNALPKIHFQLSDKSIHAVAYFFLFTLWALYGVLTFTKKSNTHIIIITAIGVVVFGIIIEYLQGEFIASRKAEFYDIVANTLGVIVGILAFSILKNYVLKLKNQI